MLSVQKLAVQANIYVVCRLIPQRSSVRSLPASFALRGKSHCSVAQLRTRLYSRASKGSRPASMAARSDTENRDFDVVIWGATGFVGQLACEHLASKYLADVRSIHSMAYYINDGALAAVAPPMCCEMLLESLLIILAPQPKLTPPPPPPAPAAGFRTHFRNDST